MLIDIRFDDGFENSAQALYKPLPFLATKPMHEGIKEIARRNFKLHPPNLKSRRLSGVGELVASPLVFDFKWRMTKSGTHCVVIVKHVKLSVPVI